MASGVPAVGMRIRGVTTLMTSGNDIFRDPLPQPVIKYKILPDEPGFQS